MRYDSTVHMRAPPTIILDVPGRYKKERCRKLSKWMWGTHKRQSWALPEKLGCEKPARVTSLPAGAELGQSCGDEQRDLEVAAFVSLNWWRPGEPLPTYKLFQRVLRCVMECAHKGHTLSSKESTYFAGRSRTPMIKAVTEQKKHRSFLFGHSLLIRL